MPIRPSALTLLLLVSVGLNGCGPAQANGPTTHAATADRTHHAHSNERGTPDVNPAPVQLPDWTNAGPPREVSVLFDSTRVKIAAIALRRGTTLPVHQVKSGITIQVIQGTGQLTIGDARIEAEAGTLVSVDPDVPHALTPNDEELVVVLVHYLKASSHRHSTPDLK